MTQPWYRGISAYQWLVLALASAGWIFDVYEGQIFNLTRKDLFADLLSGDSQDRERLTKFYGDVFLGVFLVGGALGGVLFGALADRCGRRPILIATILIYSLFSGLTYFAESLWQVAALRFLVALGTGGEWSVAAALVAEVFPARGRAQAASVFQASSIIGTWLAGWAAMKMGDDWRSVYLLGVLPAVLILVIRLFVREPEAWSKRHSQSPVDTELDVFPQSATGGFRELWSNSTWRRRAILGLLLATVGLGTFWGVTIAGQDLAREMLVRQGLDQKQAEKEARFAYGIVQATGGGLGLLAFGPLAVRFGRKRTFIFMQLAALAIVPLTCYAPSTYFELLMLLPLYGFFTLGIHAGFAVYFPELFPARLRATGAGLCFNGGRLASAFFLVFSGWLKSQPGVDLHLAVTLLSLLFVAGIGVVCLLPETRGQPLPE
jgi:MFS family permease